MRALLSFFSLLSVALSASTHYNIDGVGSSSGSPMMKQWEFSYSLLKTDLEMTFTPTKSKDAFDMLQTTCRKNYQTDFILADVNWQQRLGYIHSDALVTLPFFASALVISYNVPELEKISTPMIFTRELLYAIYSEHITTWDHPDIKKANPLISNSLPGNKTISLAIRSDDNGFNVLMQSFLQKVEDDPTNPYPRDPTQTFNSDPQWKRKMKNPVIPGDGAFGIAAAVLTNPYSIGYVPYAYTDQAGLPFAQLKNKRGAILDPEDKYLSAAVNQVLFGGRVPLVNLTNEVLADADGVDSYPLSCVIYLAYMKDTEVDCDQRREVWKFLHWILDSTAAEAQISGTVGYSPFDADSKARIISHLQKVSCQDQNLLADTYDESASTYLRQAAMSITAILLTVVLMIGIVLGLKRNNRITKAAGLAFAYCFLIGCALNYISVFVWALVPTTHSICQSRYILVALGYTLLLGSMFAKCWEVRKIFARAKSGDISPFQELPWWKFCEVFFAVISVNCILLLGLGLADPPKSYEEEIDEVELIAVHVCGVQRVDIWAGMEFAYFGCLVLWGGYLAYSTRDIWEKYNYPNESKSILMSIYNLVFCFSILLPLMTVLAGDLEVVFFFVATAIIFPTTFALFMVYGPKMLIFLSSSFKGSGGSHGGGSQGVTSKKTSKAQDSGVHKGHYEGIIPKTIYDEGLKVRETERAKDQEESLHRMRAHKEDEKNEVIAEEETVEEHTNMLLSPGTIGTPEPEQRRSPPLASNTDASPVGVLTLSGDWRVLTDDSGRHATETTHFNFDHHDKNQKNKN